MVAPMEMTSEARLDRLERIARLFVKAGLRQRRESRDQAGKIDHLINHQIANEGQFADLNGRIENLIDLQLHNEERFVDQSVRTDKLIDLQLHSEERFGNHSGRIDNLIKFQKDNEVRFARLAEYQINTDRRLEALIEIVKEGRNGKSRPKK